MHLFAITINLIIFCLVDELNQVPNDEYYKDGEMKCRFGSFNLTNLELIKCQLQGTQSCQNTTSMPKEYVTNFAKHPVAMLIGTFHDKCRETSAKKNESLDETIKVLFTQNALNSPDGFSL